MCILALIALRYSSYTSLLSSRFDPYTFFIFF